MHSQISKKQSQKKRHTKPCKYFQASTCPLSAEECDFLHVLISNPQPQVPQHATTLLTSGDRYLYHHAVAEEIYQTRSATGTAGFGTNGYEPSNNVSVDKAPMDQPNGISQQRRISTPAKELNPAIFVGGHPPPMLVPPHTQVPPITSVVAMVASATNQGADPARTTPIPYYGFYPVMAMPTYPAYPYPPGHMALAPAQPPQQAHWSHHPIQYMTATPAYIPPTPTTYSSQAIPSANGAYPPPNIDHIYSTNHRTHFSRSPAPSSEGSSSSHSNSPLSIRIPPSGTEVVPIEPFRSSFRLLNNHEHDAVHAGIVENNKATKNNKTIPHVTSREPIGFEPEWPTISGEGQASADSKKKSEFGRRFSTEDPQYAEHRHVGQQSQIKIEDDEEDEEGGEGSLIHVPPVPGAIFSATGGGWYDPPGKSPIANIDADHVTALGMGMTPTEKERLRASSRGLTIDVNVKPASSRKARSASRSAARYKATHYKTKPCRYFAADGYCSSGDRCTFIHDEPLPLLAKLLEKANLASNESSNPGNKSQQPDNGGSLESPKKEYYPVTWRVIGGGVSLSDMRNHSVSETGRMIPVSADVGATGAQKPSVPDHQHALEDDNVIVFPTLAPPRSQSKKTCENGNHPRSSPSPPRTRATSNPQTPILLTGNHGTQLFSSAESPD